MSELLKISDIFEVNYGNSLELINLSSCKSTDYNSITFVSRTENNNGVASFVEKEFAINPNPAHTLSVAVGGSVLATFYQPLEYYTGFHVLVLSPKKKLNVIEMLYYAKIISLNKYRYSYGRQANKTLRDILIPAKMPMNLNNHMASFYRQKSKTISAKSLFDEKINIDTKNWMEFKLTQLFDIKGSKTTALLELHEYGNGKCPYVTTQATNNGVKGFYDFYSESGNILTIDSAVIGYCSYQEFSFSASDHVEKLIPKFDMNKYIAMFLVTILNAEQYRYNYGLKRSQARMKESYIKLPTKKNIPDWEFMERFIKSLPYASSF